MSNNTTTTLTPSQIQLLISREEKRIQYRNEYNQKPEVIEKRKTYMKEYNSQPHVIEQRKERNKVRNALIKQLLSQHKTNS